MNLIREILRLTVLATDDMNADEKVIRINHLLIDALTETELPLKFGHDEKRSPLI